MSSLQVLRFARLASSRVSRRLPPPPSSRLLHQQQRRSFTSPRTTITTTTSNPRLTCRNFSATSRQLSGGPEEETFEEFTRRYEKEFEQVNDVFELQRNLNNAFAYDLVPAPEVVVAALKAARRVHDYPTAVRIFEAIKAKVENVDQYEQYLEALKPLREELGVNLKEDLWPSLS